jgi:cyanate permease
MNDWVGKSGYVAAGAVVGLANLSPSGWYMLLGILIGLATLGVNIYYKHKTKIHQDKIREIERDRNDRDDS